MTHALQTEIICDLCEKRFAGSQENLPNTCGRTKGTPMTQARLEAKAAGWKRVRLPSGGIEKGSLSRRPITIDLCQSCCETATIHALRRTRLWFEENIVGEMWG